MPKHGSVLLYVGRKAQDSHLDCHIGGRDSSVVRAPDS